MNSEYHICRNCKIKDTCHPVLLPIIVGRDGRSITVSKYHVEAVYSTRCGRYTCGTDGSFVANGLIADQSSMRMHEVCERDGTVHIVLAAVLGTSEKRTDIDELRIVSDAANVYAKQDGVYYFTQNIND